MTPLAFVHGFMGGSDQWDLQSPLADGRDLMCVDLPGFGQNAHMDPIYSIDRFAAWVLDELTAQGVHRFDLLGHSMGGMIAQEMMRQAPDRVDRLILYGTGATGNLPERFEPIETSIERARIEGSLVTARRIAATWFLQREAAPEYEACAAIAAQSTLPAILAGLEAMRDWSGEDHLSEITAQTLIVWGEGDRTYSWPQTELLLQTIPSSHLALVPDCAHAVHMERPKIFNRLVVEFLDRASSEQSV